MMMHCIRLNWKYQIKTVVLLLLLIGLTSCDAGLATKADLPVQHSYLCSDIGAKRVFRISAAGQIVWEYPADQCTDAWLLENGHVLMSFTGEKRGVREVTEGKDVVWEYTTLSEVWGCQRLKNGNTLVVECTANRMVEVNGQGQVVKVISVEPTPNKHMGMRQARKLENGHYLACFLDHKAVREYDASGRMIRQIDVPDLAFSATRLRNGNTVIGYRGGIIEVDARDKVIWHLTQADLPDVKLYWVCCSQRLGNGNTIVGNWFIHNRRTDSTPFFEVTRDKKVVWKSGMHERMVDPASIQILNGTAKK
ncbi:MAG: hypothetical protein K9M57_02135 [Phycisphaerae bacterium]|nr:hypothetical protein [Phycisphaerae bacterium]